VNKFLKYLSKQLNIFVTSVAVVGSYVHTSIY